MSAVETVTEAGEDQMTVSQPEGTGKAGPLRRIGLAAGRVPPAARIAIVALLVVLIAGSGVAAGLWANQASNAKATQAEETAAAAAAKAELPQILSYNYKTLNADLARAAADTTGQFSGQFGVLASQMIGPEATKQQVVTKAVVPVAAPVSSTGNQVTVLVYLDQSTTSKSQPKAQIVPSQVRVTMEKVKGKWLVAVFNAL